MDSENLDQSIIEHAEREHVFTGCLQKLNAKEPINHLMTHLHLDNNEKATENSCFDFVNPIASPTASIKLLSAVGRTSK